MGPRFRIFFLGFSLNPETPNPSSARPLAGSQESPIGCCGFLLSHPVMERFQLRLRGFMDKASDPKLETLNPRP